LQLAILWCGDAEQGAIGVARRSDLVLTPNWDTTVRFSTVAALAEPCGNAHFVVCYGYDNYTTNLPLTEALKDDVLLVHTADGCPLPRKHGGPVRVITPQLYAWKGAKWIRRIELTRLDRPGLWEGNGYSNTAHPWRNDRYAR